MLSCQVNTGSDTIINILKTENADYHQSSSKDTKTVKNFTVDFEDLFFQKNCPAKNLFLFCTPVSGINITVEGNTKRADF